MAQRETEKKLGRIRSRGGAPLVKATPVDPISGMMLGSVLDVGGDAAI